MRIDVSVIIYGYLFVCTLLMLFNFIHIFRSNRQNKNMERNIEKWFHEVLIQIERIRKNRGVDPWHLRKISQRLLKADVLMSYSRALLAVKKFDSAALQSYLRIVHVNLQQVAFQYGRRNSMERGFFADVIQRFPPCHGDEYRPLIDILISYLSQSTLYCQESVLGALCALGNIQAVENALQIFNDSDWFHHQKMISENLAAFAGDKEALAARLWGMYKRWKINLMLAVVKFITICSPHYKEIFYTVLRAAETESEIRLAVMRYYRRHHYEPVRPILLNYLTSGNRTHDITATVAALVLENYPGEETVRVLKGALSHPDWYVRNNAATALIKMRTPNATLEEVLNGRDLYAKEILLYKLENYLEGDMAISLKRLAPSEALQESLGENQYTEELFLDELQQEDSL